MSHGVSTKRPPTPTRPGAPKSSRMRALLLRTPRGRPQPLLSLRRWLRIVGPGLVTGAADDDPSGIGTYSQAGATFGTGQLWLALYMLPLLIAVQEMCARIGLVTGQGIAAVVRQHYNRRVLFAAVSLVLVANMLNIGADLGAMAATIQLFVPVAPIVLLVVVLAVGILALEVFIPYRRYAIVLKILALSLLAYVATGLIIGPQGGALLLATLAPNIQLTPLFLSLVVGVLGTTISPYLFFWQASEEVEELEVDRASTPTTVGDGRRAKPMSRQAQRAKLLTQLHALRIDTVIGMVASEVATWFIIFTTGSVLHTHGVTTITTADQAAAALEPLVKTFPNAGLLAKVIFAMGIIGVGLLGGPVLAGSAAYAVAEAFHWKEGLAKTFRQAPGFYLVIGVATLVGMLLNLLRINPIEALVYSAIINGIVAVPLLVLILLVANNRAIMREYTNGALANTVGIFTTVAMGAAVVALAVTFFWH